MSSVSIGDIVRINPHFQNLPPTVQVLIGSTLRVTGVRSDGFIIVRTPSQGQIVVTENMLEGFSASDPGPISFKAKKPKTTKAIKEEEEMSAAIDKAKMMKAHELLVQRYLESASKPDEDLILLLDTGITDIEDLYQTMGHKEHPVFSRNQWVSSVSANLTDLGYWSWAKAEVGKATSYTYGGNGKMVLKTAPVAPSAPSPSIRLEEALERLANHPSPPQFPPSYTL